MPMRSDRDDERPAHAAGADAEVETAPTRPQPVPGAAGFQSILFPNPKAGDRPEVVEAPDFFRDLNLDQVVAAITEKYDEYRITPFFHEPLHDADAVMYRQEVMRDLEDENLRRSIGSFARRMHDMRSYFQLAKQLDYPHEKQRRFLGAAEAYCDAVRQLVLDLRATAPRSRGLRAFRTRLEEYAASAGFHALADEARDVAADLSAITYGMFIRDGSVTVRPYEGEPDYAAAVEATFDKFRRGNVKDYRTTIRDYGRLNHVEAAVLERVARLNPEAFTALEAFCAAHAGFLDATVARFDREIQFYVAYHAYIDRLRQAGLGFCYPDVSNTSKEVVARGAFDVALAAKLVAEKGTVVPNDFCVANPERILVVSGPNHGGKTTFARMFGQLHYLATLGGPVPGTEARLLLFDHLFTHFERAEAIENLRGKLEDDLVRVRTILEQATPGSIVIMNELFASTTLKDAVYLSKQILERISCLDVLAVCVTFLDELATFNEKTVSMVSTVKVDDPAVRTFRLERRPADGLAYAHAVAEKYRVTYDWLARRLRA